MMRTKMMALLLLMMPVASARAALVAVDDFSDILFWTGSGTNEAALVLQFPAAVESGTATPTSIAWGYRWDGAATFAGMVFSLAGEITGGPQPVAGADPRLAVDVTFFGEEFGYFVNTIQYDQRGLPSGDWSQAVRQIGPYDPDTGEYPAQYQLDTAGGSWTGAAFNLSNVGMSTTPLAVGGWYGFVQADGSAATLTFAQPVSAVPEPSSVVMLACGGAIVGAMAWRRRRAA